MNRYVSCSIFLIVCILMICPVNLESSQFRIKLGLGFSSGGKIEDTWTMTEKFYTLHLSDSEKTGLPIDVSMELVYQINPNFGLSFGTGYISKGISGSLGRFSVPPGSTLSGDFAYNPYFNSRLFPLYVSAIWSYPLMLEVEIFILGGLGYYFGKISCLGANLDYNLHDPENLWNYFDWKYKSNVSALGFHAGIGFEYPVSNQSALFIAAIYRIVNIGSFDSINKDIEDPGRLDVFDLLGDEIKGLADRSTFLYAQRFGGEQAWGDINYRITNLSFSGISLRLGYRFKF